MSGYRALLFCLQRYSATGNVSSPPPPLMTVLSPALAGRSSPQDFNQITWWNRYLFILFYFFAQRLRIGYGGLSIEPPRNSPPPLGRQWMNRQVAPLPSQFFCSTPLTDLRLVQYWLLSAHGLVTEWLVFQNRSV